MAFPKEDISVSFWVKFQECSQASNLSSTEQVCQRGASIQLGTIALMAHLGQRSSSSLLSGLDVSRLEPHRLGLSPTRILASPIIGLSSTDWPVSRPFTRSSGRREGAEQDFQPLKSDWSDALSMNSCLGQASVFRGSRWACLSPISSHLEI